jgi:cyanophycin synthetase
MPSNNDASNITLRLINYATEARTEPAIILEQHHITYGALDQLVWQASQYLFDNGIRYKCVVALRMTDEFLRAIYSLALARLGATLLPLARSLTEHQELHLQTILHVDFVVSDQSTGLVLGMSPIVASAQSIRRSKVDFSILCERPQSDLLIVPSSGSTGRQKLIPQTHWQMAQRCTIAFSHHELKEPVRIISLTNLEFASGLNRLLSTLSKRGAVSMFVPPLSQLGQYCEKRGITTLFSSVFHAEKLIASISSGPRPLLRNIKSLRLSGSSVGLELRKRVRESLTENLYIVYGANECGRITMLSPPDVFEDGLSVGYPLEGVEIEIVNDNDKKLGVGGRGHIKVRTPTLVRGYIGDTEATERSFKGGWFHTGDIGEVTAHGSIRHYGRSDGMMIMNGINIFPAEIEMVFKGISGVLDAAVLPLKHPIHQDLPVCFVVLADRSSLTGEQLGQIARDKLGFRAPRRIIKLNAIPRNPNGKLQKEDLVRLLDRMK